MDPELVKVSNPPVCDGFAALVYANNQPAPCKWIKDVREWAKTTDSAYYINQYVTDKGMEILGKYRSGEELLQSEHIMIGELNRAIYDSPRPDSGFSVLRGITKEPQHSLVPGRVLLNGICRSGSFDPAAVLQGYYIDDQQSAVLRIHIPKGSIVTWHPSEDQVIFPIGAQFLIVSRPQTITIPLQWDPQESVSTHVQDVINAIYIDAPNNALHQPIPSQFLSFPNYPMYQSMEESKYQFPYRIPSSIRYQDSNPALNWSKHVVCSADCANGIVHAARMIDLPESRKLSLQWLVPISHDQVGLVLYEESMNSSSTRYTVHFSNGEETHIENGALFLQGFISVTHQLGLDYKSYITNLRDGNGVNYQIITE